MYENKGLILTAPLPAPLRKKAAKPEAEDPRKENVRQIRSLFSRCRIAAGAVHGCPRIRLRQLLRLCFAGAARQTVSYLYINCGGSAQGLQLALEEDGGLSLVTLAQLRQLLGEFPGTKVVLLEAVGNAVTAADQAAFRKAVADTFGNEKSCHVLAALTGREAALTPLWCKAVQVDPFLQPPEAEPTEEGYFSLSAMLSGSGEGQGAALCCPEEDRTPLFGPEAVYEGMFFGAPQPLRKNSGLILTSFNPPDGAQAEQEQQRQAWLLERRRHSCAAAEELFESCGIVSQTVEVSREKSIKSCILEYFADAAEDSVNYLYITCRCNADGLVIYRGKRAAITVSFRELREILDLIPGRTFLLLSGFRSPQPLVLGHYRMSAADLAARAVENMYRAFRQPEEDAAIRVLAACEVDPERMEGENSSVCTALWLQGVRPMPGSCAPRCAAVGGSFASFGELADHTRRGMEKAGTAGVCVSCPAGDPMPALGLKAYSPVLLRYNGDGIDECHAFHRAVLGAPTGQELEQNRNRYRDYEGGVIVRFSDGLTEPFHRILFTPVRLRRREPGQEDLSVVVSISENDTLRVEQRRFRGGPEELVFTKDGRMPDDPDDALEGYASGVLHSGTALRVTMQILDGGKPAGDLILTLHRDNGWGLSYPERRDCDSFFQGRDTAIVRGVRDKTGQFCLDYIISRLD